MANGELTMQLDQSDYLSVMGALSEMTQLEREAAVAKGLQEGAKIIAKAGKSMLKATLSREPQNVRMRTGNLYKSIGVKTRKKDMKAYAGFRKGGNHAHLVSDGTDKRYTKRGFYRGSVSKGMPNTGSRFWRKAFESTKDNAAKEVVDSIKETLNNILARNSR